LVSAAVQLAASLQGFILVLFLVAKAERRTLSNLFLAGASLVFCLCMADDFLGTIKLYDGLPAFVPYIGNALPSLVGPCLYLHVRSQIEGPAYHPERLWRHGWCFYLLAFLVVLVALDPAPASLSGATPTRPELIAVAIAAISVLGSYLLTAVQGLFYLLAALKATGAAAPAAAYGATRLSWLRMLVQAMTGLWLLYVVNTGVLLFVGPPTAMTLIFSIGYALVLYGMAWISLHHASVFLRAPGDVVSDLVAPLTKYRKSAQTSEDARRILGKLEAAIGAGGLYRDNGLTLARLARHIGASPNAVSQAINQQRGLNFFDLVNSYRIEEAKRLLRDPAAAERTVLEIAFAVGFNAKSTFNAAFKKVTGMTPTVWRGSSR
jgi:AraC-like DNA-binding protein